MQGKLMVLCARMEALPDRRKGVERIGTLARYDRLITRASNSWRAAQRVRVSVSAIFPDVAIKDYDHGMLEIVKYARVLLGRLDSVSAVETASVEATVERLCDASKRAEMAVQSAWKTQVEERTHLYERFLAAARAAHLPGTQALEKGLARLRTFVSITPEEVTGFQESDAAVRAAIRKLGLEGIAGEFLVSVADQAGDPRDLQREEVVAFLDDHDLWSALKIVLK